MSVEDGIPEEGQAAHGPAHDWERDYKALQAEYTRSQQTLKDHESTWEDEQAVLTRLAEKFPHLLAEEEDEDTPQGEDEFEDPREAELKELKQRLEKLEPWQRDVELERAEARFSRDLTKEVGDRQLTDRQKTWIKDRTTMLGNNPAALKKAVEDFQALEEELRGPTRRQTPTPPQPGKAGEPKYDPRDRDARRARMAASIEATKQD